MRIFTVLALAPAVFISWPATSSASTTVFTDKAAWEDAVGGQFLTEDFADDQLKMEISFTSTESGHINPAQECYQDVLASTSQNEPMTTWSFAPGITGYGGDWTLGGPGGSGNTLLVYVADSYVGTILNSYNGGFWGFTSDIPFTSVELIGGAGIHQQHYCLDNMVYSPVDEHSADFDGDGNVNGDDFLIWQSGFGIDGTGDADGDGDTDEDDFLIWQSEFGSGSGSASMVVPEPTSVLLLLGVAVGGICVRRRGVRCVTKRV